MRFFAFSVASMMMLMPNVRAERMPEGFVYLREVAPSILQDIRYSTQHNFIGRPVNGYYVNECILTKQAADALVQVQRELLRSNLSLKVYDCYRPQMAVDDFVAWSKKSDQTQMKAEFYPRTDKQELFKQKYIAEKSGHTRGSTVDLTIVPLPTMQEEVFYVNQELEPCYAMYHRRFRDNGIDMGTGYDCMDVLSHGDNREINTVAYANRMMLRELMGKYGFEPYTQEWWHFTLKNEPYPDKYFNFSILAKPKS